MNSPSAAVKGNLWALSGAGEIGWVNLRSHGAAVLAADFVQGAHDLARAGAAHRLHELAEDVAALRGDLFQPVQGLVHPVSAARLEGPEVVELRLLFLGRAPSQLVELASCRPPDALTFFFKVS